MSNSIGEMKTYGLNCQVYVFDDGTLDACVMVKNELTGRGTVLRYSSEYRAEFDTEAEFLSNAFHDFCDQLDEFLSNHSDF